MKVVTWLLVGLTLTGTVGAQSRSPDGARESSWARYERMMRTIRETRLRAEMLRPVRRDAPLRELNITDEEVREIQGLIRNLLPRDLVNISPVVEGCACEEGPECSAQVYVVALKGDWSRGLQLSRVAKAWRVGVIQQWWLDYEAVQSRVKSLPFDEALRVEYDHATRFPACTAQPAVDSVLTRHEERLAPR